jgi:hypothetical protein
MADEQIEGVEQAVAQASESETQTERQETVQDDQTRRRNDAEYNWAETRRKLDEHERVIREQREIIDRLQKSPEEPEEDLSTLSKEDIITVGQHERLSAKIAKKEVSEALRKYKAETMEDRLRVKYPDFDQVLTKENIELLKQNDPELAESIHRLADDPYTQSVAAYKLLKREGYSTQKSTAPSVEKKKAIENSQKPISVNAVTKQSAIGNVHAFENGLTAELKAQFWKEVQQACKG